MGIDQGIGHRAFPEHVGAPYKYFEDKLPLPKPGQRFLDLCCGTGVHSIRPAQLGYNVVGVDLSKKSIDQAIALAQKFHVDDRISFHHGDALEFLEKQDPFDIIFCSGSLYYLDFKKAIALIKKKLKPHGQFFGIETRADNSLMNSVRGLRQKISERRGGGYRDERTMKHLLHDEDIEFLKRYFSRSEVKYFDLLTLVGSAVPKGNMLSKALQEAASRADRLLLNRLPARRFAFKIVFHGVASPD